MADLDPQQQQAMIPGPGGMMGAMQPGGALPATNPVQPQAQQQPMPQQQQGANPQDFSSLVQSVMGLPQFAGPMGQLSEIGKKEEDIRQQQAGLTPPKYGPQIDKGQSFLHNLGQVLLMAMTATKPGAAIERAAYAPGIKEYEAKRTGLASQLETLKQQEAVPTEQLRATTGGAQAAGLAQYRGGQLGINKERADAYAQNVQGRLQRELAQTAQGWQGLDIKAKQQAAQQWYQQQMIVEKDKAIAAGLSENDARVAAAQGIAAAADSLGITKEFPWMSLGQAVGLVSPGVVPPAPQPAGAASATAQPRPMPPAKGAAAPAAKGNVVPKGTIVYDPQGRPHTSDGTQPLPPNWSLKKK